MLCFQTSQHLDLKKGKEISLCHFQFQHSWLKKLHHESYKMKNVYCNTWGLQTSTNWFQIITFGSNRRWRKFPSKFESSENHDGRKILRFHPRMSISDRMSDLRKINSKFGQFIKLGWIFFDDECQIYDLSNNKIFNIEYSIKEALHQIIQNRSMNNKFISKSYHEFYSNDIRHRKFSFGQYKKQIKFDHLVKWRYLVCRN